VVVRRYSPASRRGLGSGQRPATTRQRRYREATPAEQVGHQFYIGFAITALIMAAWSLRSYLRMDGERFEVLRLLTSSVMPLGILTAVVLG
jgi:hypothetical protein